MKASAMTQGQLAERIRVHQAMAGMAKAMDQNTVLGKTPHVDDSVLRKAMAQEALAQKMHTGAAAAAKNDSKAGAKASTHPEMAMRTPSRALASPAVRVAPSASSAKARGFAERARKAAK